MEGKKEVVKDRRQKRVEYGREKIKGRMEEREREAVKDKRQRQNVEDRREKGGTEEK